MKISGNRVKSAVLGIIAIITLVGTATTVGDWPKALMFLVAGVAVFLIFSLVPPNEFDQD